LKVLESRVLREMFGSERDEVTGNWRRLHSEELYDVYSSSNIIWVIQYSHVSVNDGDTF
jgi:hypothetical protein